MFTKYEIISCMTNLWGKLTWLSQETVKTTESTFPINTCTRKTKDDMSLDTINNNSTDTTL